MITIVGAGALGSHVAFLLRNEKPGLKVVDFDRVEQKNILAQFHTKMSLGRNKAQALQQALQGMFGVKIEAVPHKLTADNAETVLGGSELVIDCTDNIAARNVIMDTVRKLDLPCLHGALSASGGFGQIIWDDIFKPDAESGDGAETCVDGEHLPFYATTSAYIAVEAQMFLKNGKKKSWQVSLSGIIQVA